MRAKPPLSQASAPISAPANSSLMASHNDGPEDDFVAVDMSSDSATLKVLLLERLIVALQGRHMRQKELAELLGLPQPKISTLLAGFTEGVSVEKLLVCLPRAGLDVTISIQDPQEEQAPQGENGGPAKKNAPPTRKNKEGSVRVLIGEDWKNARERSVR